MVERARGARVIVHADMDAFFAAVEQRDDPGLRGRPLLIGGTGPRSVVATASYEARRFGVGSAMPMALARRKVPAAVVVPPRFARYKEVSAQVMGVFAEFAEQVQPLSIDEAFLDLTAGSARFASPFALGRALKDAVRAATGLTVSVGVADTCFVAKIASDLHKPDGLTVVPPKAALEFLAPLPVRRLWGAGPKTVERLHGLGLQTIGQVRACDPGLLTAALGSAGHHFWRLAHNDDPRVVAPGGPRKSVGAERTLSADIVGPEAVRACLEPLAAEVARRAAAEGVSGLGVRLKLKTSGFQVLTRQGSLPRPSAEAADLLRVATALLAELALDAPLRLVGLTLYDLVGPGAPVQLELPLAEAASPKPAGVRRP